MRDQDQHQRESAYFLWENAGRPDGMDLGFWYAAQQSKPAADNGRDEQHAIVVGREDISGGASSRLEETGTPVAKKKKRQKR
jgi:hypothetical protein